MNERYAPGLPLCRSRSSSSSLQELINEPDAAMS